MSIYRGPGGSSDATSDATSQSILAAASAVAAANSEASAAANATSAASSASAASTSATNASNSANAAEASATNAANSATSAASSASTATTKASEASTSATNAASSATSAATSATNASNSATSAASSASTATTKAAEASTSATAAAASATAAATSETNADISEANAASSATAADSSATSAAASATSATNSASTATTQATNAASSATAAATSASNAATSATNASNSATSASSSASTATTQATSASNSASAAATSATNAANSATAAASSATDAQSSEDAAAAYAASINPANFLTKANNLSDLTNTSTARTNLGVAIGTNVQAYSSELQAISNGGGNAMFKNRIINGAMMVDQRNAGASVTPANGAYTVDRWKFELSQASKLSCQQSTTGPKGLNNFLVISSSSAYTVGAAEVFRLVQNIEAFNTSDFQWGTSSAQAVTLSFWLYSSLTGSFGGAVCNNGSTRSYPFSYTIPSANTWTYITVTIPGDTSGTWVKGTNGIGLQLRFSLGTGSSSSGTANTWASADYTAPTGSVSVVGTNGAAFYITGVQLEKGSTATSFDYRPYGTELALCQRYYYKSSTSTSVVTLNGYIGSTWHVTMRAAPTCTLTNGTIQSTDIDGIQIFNTGQYGTQVTATAEL